MFSHDTTFQQFEYKEHDKYLLRNGRDSFFIVMRALYISPDHLFEKKINLHISHMNKIRRIIHP